jgi:hypothetical protein
MGSTCSRNAYYVPTYNVSVCVAANMHSTSVYMYMYVHACIHAYTERQACIIYMCVYVGVFVRISGLAV